MAIRQLLDYCATYPNDGILYRASDTVLAGHADAGSTMKPEQEAEQAPISFCLKMNTFPVGMAPY